MAKVLPPPPPPLCTACAMSLRMVGVLLPRPLPKRACLLRLLSSVPAIGITPPLRFILYLRSCAIARRLPPTRMRPSLLRRVPCVVPLKVRILPPRLCTLSRRGLAAVRRPLSTICAPRTVLPPRCTRMPTRVPPLILGSGRVCQDVCPGQRLPPGF